MADSFNNRLRVYRQLQAEHEAFHAGHVVNVCHAHDHISARCGKLHPDAKAAFQRCLDVEEEFGRYVDRTADAMNDAIKFPAPDLAALATKIELMLDDGMFENGGNLCHELAGALLADVKRLAA